MARIIAMRVGDDLFIGGTRYIVIASSYRKHALLYRPGDDRTFTLSDIRRETLEADVEAHIGPGVWHGEAVQLCIRAPSQIAIRSCGPPTKAS
jgi:hypothetical protein